MEHLLRDINDPSTSILSTQIKQKIVGLQTLVARLNEIKTYLLHVINGRMPPNNQIIYNLQDILNLLPNLNIEELVRSLLIKTNDMHLIMYVSSLVRSVIALHGLLNNKIKYRDIDDVLDRGAGIEAPSASPEIKANGTVNEAEKQKDKDSAGGGSGKEDSKGSHGSNKGTE